MWLLSHSWQEKGISTCQILSLSLSCSLSLCSVSKNISSDNVNCSTAVLNITHVSPPAILYLLIKADRQINQGSVCVESGGVCARTRTGVSMWPCGSNSRRVSRSASPFSGNDWQLSCLHGCRLIFVRSHLFDGGSEGSSLSRRQLPVRPPHRAARAHPQQSDACNQPLQMKLCPY